MWTTEDCMTWHCHHTYNMYFINNGFTSTRISIISISKWKWSLDIMRKRRERSRVIVPDHLLKYCGERGWKIKESFIIIGGSFTQSFPCFVFLCMGRKRRKGDKNSVVDDPLSALWLVMLCWSIPLIGCHLPGWYLAPEWSRCLWVAWLFQLFDRYSCNCLYTSVSSTQDTAQYWTAK